MKIHTMKIDIFSRNTMEACEDGQAWLDGIIDLLDIVPEKYDYVEPIKRNFDLDSYEQIIKEWDNGFLWKCRGNNPNGMCMWRIGKSRVHGNAIVTSTPGKLGSREIENYLKETSIALNADYAYAHALTDWDLPLCRATKAVFCCSRRPNARWHLMISTHKLREFLPDLWWANVFGPSYVKLFGMKRLLSAPAPIVEKLDDELVYIQLSDDIYDLKSKFMEVQAVRDAVKEHLNCNAFFSPKLGLDHKYNVPEFNLSPGKTSKELLELYHARWNNSGQEKKT